jgi:hypothetical protein
MAKAMPPLIISNADSFIIPEWNFIFLGIQGADTSLTTLFSHLTVMPSSRIFMPRAFLHSE